MDIQTFSNFLTLDECDRFQKIILNVDSTNFTDNGSFKNKKWTDLKLATDFFKRLIELDKNNITRYIRANKLIIVSIYDVGDSFGFHTDTGLFYDKSSGEESRWTLLIYLNDNFEGGETAFYDTDTWKEVLRIKPQKGMALIFDIDLWHSGLPLLSGNKKWIGCEIIGKIK